MLLKRFSILIVWSRLKCWFYDWAVRFMNIQWVTDTDLESLFLLSLRAYFLSLSIGREKGRYWLAGTGILPSSHFLSLSWSLAWWLKIMICILGVCKKSDRAAWQVFGICEQLFSKSYAFPQGMFFFTSLSPRAKYEVHLRWSKHPRLFEKDIVIYNY